MAAYITQFVNSSILSIENATTKLPTSQHSLTFGLVIEIVFLWIIFGNIILITVLKLYKPLTIPDILVFSLALADLLNVLFPAQALNLIESNVIKSKWTNSLCIAFTWCTYSFRLSSVLTISVISLDRLIAIQKPLLYRARVMHEIKKVKILILVLWLFSCLLASLPYMGLGKSGFVNGQCHYQLKDLGLVYGIFIEVIGVAQLLLVLYCYIAIRISTGNFMKRQDKFIRHQIHQTASTIVSSDSKKSKKAMESKSMKRQTSEMALTDQGPPEVDNGEDARQANNDGKYKDKRSFLKKHFGSKRNATETPMITDGMKQVAKMEKMMAALVFLFYLSWLPFLVSNFFSLLTRKSNDTARTLVGIFSLINGFINPIVYATIYPRYKKGYLFVLKTIFRICGGSKSSITIADFDSSKVKRLRRLQTLKEMKSNASMTSITTMKSIE